MCDINMKETKIKLDFNDNDMIEMLTLDLIDN
jgi:hypothetical protein